MYEYEKLCYIFATLKNINKIKLTNINTNMKNIKFFALLICFSLQMVSFVANAQTITPIQIAKGMSSSLPAQYLVITNVTDWNSFKAAMGYAVNNFTEKEIDFSQYEVIVVIDQMRSNGCWDMNITRVTEYANYIDITVTIKMPGIGSMCPQVIVQPYHIIKIPASNKNIAFNGRVTFIKPTSFTLQGTVVPFVYHGNPSLDALFTVTACLYPVPEPGNPDPVRAILRSTPLYTTTAVRYDGATHYIPGTPKYPAFYDRTGNPPANATGWELIERTQYPVNATALLPGENPEGVGIGLYTFHNVAPGNYVLVLSRAGYIPRFAKISVSSGDNTLLGHLQMIGGDINGDFNVDIPNITEISKRIGIAFGDAGYDAKYDLNGNGEIELSDISLVKFYHSVMRESDIEAKE